MDAISFVMGEKTASLRVKRLSDLIHGASINRAVSNRASVSAIFTKEDGSELTFSRSIIGSSAEYRINLAKESISRIFHRLVYSS